MFAAFREKAKKLKNDIFAIAFCLKDPRVPVSARILTVITAGYALSPIDLIPDFIPVLGFLDDLIILPALIVLIVRLIPPQILEEYREKVRNGQHMSSKAKWVVATVIILSWFCIAAGIVRLIFGF
ncbi:MAG: DUF1232 domain-containing protein [Spirochaetales bacterium]|nr:DUF1232 domain-containing protein [Spirochaetales bacterium]